MAAPVMLVQGRGWGVIGFGEITCTLLSVIDCHRGAVAGEGEEGAYQPKLGCGCGCECECE